MTKQTNPLIGILIVMGIIALAIALSHLFTAVFNGFR